MRWKDKVNEDMRGKRQYIAVERSRPRQRNMGEEKRGGKRRPHIEMVSKAYGKKKVYTCQDELGKHTRRLYSNRCHWMVPEETLPNDHISKPITSGVARSDAEVSGQ